ncbi:Putative PLP-dependent enzyme possibly involved in cell wall biogenesis [Idiomarina sp. A28L]|uniref:DegT/DnrJ/EryC1/StrS family aminotransferase n=1 Tax=Idiomarina sp. A28L TaxID=1036674 RepID=UPI0002138CBD|nr:DegT/DnrJ/EryC1/StrS family aminotransferase [Idiomarina sp. A28L]EGN74613.1 Putative PLP-dependent enzyme possibly involved in cell wall biogenesis [Idiomarina sp. A28L]
MVKFLDLAAQYQTIQQEIDTAIRDVIAKSAFIGGEYVNQFEQDFAGYSQVEHCIGVANGTDAIEIAIEALNLPQGSEIIVPANSFIASSEAVTRQGHKVVFADCDPQSYVISIEDSKKRITPKTKAIIAVHLYGHPCDMDALQTLADQHGLYIIEDCAQSHGAEYKGKRIGSIGDIATFSFYPGKNLGAYGDGGAITTNNAELARKSRMIANHGRIAKYDHEFEGRNSRLDGLQAAILSVKLKYLPEWTRKRIAVADYYLAHLKDIQKITLPVRQDWAKQVYHLFVIRTEQRDDLAKFLGDKGIQTGVHYPLSLPKLKAYDYINQASEDLFANKTDTMLLSLPIGEHLNEEDLGQVVAAIKEYFA